MKAVVCRAFGEPQNLSVEDLPSPGVSDGQVKIAVRAAAVSFFDILMVQGLYQRRPALPFTAGSEAVGEIVAVGPGVTGLSVGDRVAAFNLLGGAYAEEMVVPADEALPIPESVSFETAAAVKSSYGTALHGLRDRARLQSGEQMLVLGASGSVGLAFLEVGRLLGAKLIAAVGSDEKARLLQRLGFKTTVNYSKEPLRDRVHELTAGKGADVIIDPVGGDAFDQAARAIAWGGRLCVIGFASGRIPQLAMNKVLLKSFDVVGVNWGTWIYLARKAQHDDARQLMAWCAEGKLAPHVSATLPLQEVARAMGMLQDRSATGKVLLRPTPA